MLVIVFYVGVIKYQLEKIPRLQFTEMSMVCYCSGSYSSGDNLVAGGDQLLDVDVSTVEGRHAARGKECFVVVVNRDVEHFGGNERILAEKSVPVAAFEHQDHARMLRL